MKLDEFGTQLITDIRKYRDERVWVTKKIRMEAEQRVNFNNMHFQILSNYYSISTLAVSVVALYTKDNVLDFWNLIISILLISVTLANTTLKYDTKSLEYKKSYLSINNIEGLFDSLIYRIESSYNPECLNGYIDKFEELKKSYNKVLENSDNHAHIDFITYTKKRNKTLTHWNDRCVYFMYALVSKIAIMFLYVAPIFIIIIKISNGAN